MKPNFMHLGQLLKILNCSSPEKGVGKDPFFRNVEFLFENNNKGPSAISLETQFHASRLIIEDFAIPSPQKKEGRALILKFYLRILIGVPM